MSLYYAVDVLPFFHLRMYVWLQIETVELETETDCFCMTDDFCIVSITYVNHCFGFFSKCVAGGEGECKGSPLLGEEFVRHAKSENCFE